MSEVTFIEIDGIDGKQTHAIIKNNDGNFTSMPKAEYDRQQAEQSTPMVTDEAATL